MQSALRTPAILLFVALSLSAGLGFPVPHAAADPILLDNSDGTTDAVWNFTNPADYLRTNTSISAQAVSLESQVGWWNTTSAADFAGPDNATNVNWTRWPGDVVLASTSGSSLNITIQPDSATGKDAYLDKTNPTLNHGTDTTMVLDLRAASTRRPVLQFDLSAIPTGAVIDDARLSLYQSGSAANPTTAEVHALTTAWDEGTVTWDTPWNAKGGDYSSRIVALLALDSTTGWKTWNVTSLVDLWYRGRLPNYGLILTGPNAGGGPQDKTFWSSDYTDPSLRPKLDVRYRILDATGEYISHVGGPGTFVRWQSISWNATERSLATDEFDGASLEAKWAWTNPPPAYDVGTTTPGSLHVVSQTGVELDGPTFTGHVLANEIVGDFTAVMKMSSDPTADGQKAGLIILVDARNWYAIQKTRVAGTVVWQAKATVDTLSTIRANVSSGNPIPAWLRIARVGNSFAASTSPDGVTWTLQDTYTPAFEYPLQIRLALFVADGNSGTAHMIDVDYVRVTLGNDATVEVRTRIGDTSPVDGTWSGWSAPYPTSSGSAMTGRSRYVEFRLSFRVVYPEHTPVVGDVNISWVTYKPSGTVETNDLVPPDLDGWGTFSVVEVLNNQSIAYACSVDSGATWYPVAPPGPLPAGCQGGTKLRFRATLSTTDTTVTPILREMRITYVHRLDHFYVSASPTATAGTAFTVTVAAKDAANATIASWTGTVTLEARLSDGITPGGGVLGTTAVTISSGGTVSLTTETYTRAETIRIRASAATATGLSDLILVAPGSIANATITPDNVTLLPLDAQSFVGQGFDAWGNAIPGLSFDWSTSGGVGSLNASMGPSVTFTASTLGNGTVTATSGSVSAWAQVHVVPGVRPWIAIGSPTPGAYLTGITSIMYANSSDSVSVRFEYDGGAGWTLIGTTAVLDGAFPWDTRGLNFTGGSLRAIVTNNRTVTNTTVVTPISVDNAPPTISLGAVSDDQATSGTLTLTYGTSPDVVRVDLIYFDGSWHPIGSDLTVDGTYVWTPGTPINGVTVRAVAADRVGLTGVDEEMGVGRLVVGTNGPTVQPLPVLHVQVGVPYVLNLTFYVSDPDTPLAGLTIWTSDAANVTVVGGPYPTLTATYGSLGTFRATVWVSDGTDTAWQILTIIASGNRPPVLVQALPTVTFEQNTVAMNGLGAPATAFFTDPDGDALAFTILDAARITAQVQANATLDFSAALDWYGSESLRLRATDPTGAFAEASFLVIVRYADRPPVLAPIPDLTVTAGEPYVLDLTPYLSDADTPLADLVVTVDSPYVAVNGHQLILNFPANWTGSQFTITVSDGSKTASQTVRATLRTPAAPTTPVEPWWQTPYLLTIPPAALLVVVAMFAQRQRFRPAKAFLVDERGQLLRELTLDPSCTVSFEQAVKEGALDARDKDVRVAKYHARCVRGDALAIVLLAYGPVNLQEVEFAREILVNIQDRFEDRVKERLEEARAREEALRATASEVQEAQRNLQLRARVFGDLVNAVTIARSKMEREAADLRAREETLAEAHARLAEERQALEARLREVEQARASLAPRIHEVEQREADAGRREEEADMREADLASREASLAERETQFASKEKALAERAESLGAREARLEEDLAALQAREADLREREDQITKERLALEAQSEELESRRMALEAKASELEAQARDIARRLEELEAVKANLGPREKHVLEREAELAEKAKALDEERATLQRQSDLVAAKALEVQQREAALQDREATLAEEKQLLQDAEGAFEEERRAFQERMASAEAELQRRREELEAQGRALGEERLRLAREREDFERLRDEKEQGIASKEIELESREQSLLEKEASVRAQGEESARRLAEVVAREEALEIESAKIDRARGELESKKGELAALQEELDRKVAKFREEEARKAEELRTWQTTLESEQTLLKEQRETFEAEMRDLRESWAGRMLRVEQREAELTEREAKIQSDVEWVARSESELARREKDAEEALKSANAMKAEAEKLRMELEQRALEIESRERALREEAAAQAVELTKRSESLAAQEAELVEKRTRADADMDARMKRLQDLEADLQKRAQALDAKAAELDSQEARLHSLQEFTRQEGERLLREKADVQKLAGQLEDRQLELNQMKERLEAEAARLQAEADAMHQALAAKEADLRSERERLERESTSLQEKLGAKAQEMAAREKALAAREDEVRAEEQDLEARLRELETRERQAAAHGIEIAAQLEALARRERELNDRTAQFEEMVRRFEAETEAKRKEWDAFQEALKSKEAMLTATAESQRLEITKRIEELAQREHAVNAATTQIEIERSKLETLGKSLAAKEADVAASMARAEKRAEELKAMEDELLKSRQAFESERAAWSARRSEELKQLEATRDSAAEQVQQAERLIEEAQRRAYVAEEAEKAAKRRIEELAALQAQTEARRAEAERAEQDLQAHMAQLQEASQKLATKEVDLAARAKELEARQARLAERERAAEAASSEIASRKEALDQEAARLAALAAELDRRRAEDESRRAAIETKLNEIAKRDQALSTELQRADNLMEDLARKEAELAAREKVFASAEGRLKEREEALNRREAELLEGMQALERTNQEIANARASAETDRKAAASMRQEAEAIRAEAEKLKGQAEAMQAEVSKNMRFLQKKALDILDREEKNRALEFKIEEEARALNARAEVLANKEKVLEAERAEWAARLEQLRAENEKLKARLSEVQAAPPPSQEVEAWKKDIENRVKIIQRKALELLDREEKLRKKEEELRALAEQIGVQS